MDTPAASAQRRAQTILRPRAERWPLMSWPLCYFATALLPYLSHSGR